MVGKHVHVIIVASFENALCPRITTNALSRSPEFRARVTFFLVLFFGLLGVKYQKGTFPCDSSCTHNLCTACTGRWCFWRKGQRKCKIVYHFHLQTTLKLTYNNRAPRITPVQSFSTCTPPAVPINEFIYIRISLIWLPPICAVMNGCTQSYEVHNLIFPLRNEKQNTTDACHDTEVARACTSMQITSTIA